ncbi:DUF2157 domain-containing protein [Flavobacterium cheongpyeongense]|uniref:DUF2157 domain-containing protein n=1 Tax=Flavobacterium cheongpyeongense TaxID=2212651 RepID=A0A2V4BQI7_9FLAO|nr:DUF2157 domain-containing protein [Flavobacterium cheongpyeongense]PXY41279.1 DUF2157 domain-containing protein [Flavobacterium cheongpyeongense]
MAEFKEQASQKLFERNFITEEQLIQIKSYRSLGIFSLNAELKMFLYLSVLLFTSGIGILIYQNIDTIGHVVILSLLFIVTIICFYFCFKNSKGFQKTATTFESPVLEYLVLLANILTCIFIGYLQFQYQPFGIHYGLATLVPTIVSFICAYYFDNKSVLTIAITGLAAYIGFSVTPQDIFHNDFYSNQELSYSAIILGGLLILWTIYSSRVSLKTHFNLTYLTFALHMISIASISNMVNEYEGLWVLFSAVFTGFCFYFYKASYQQKAISLYVFMIIYAYIGINIFLFRVFESIDFQDIWVLFVLAIPGYFIGSIVLFIKLIKNFNKNITS